MLVPKDNRADVEELSSEITKGLEILLYGAHGPGPERGAHRLSGQVLVQEDSNGNQKHKPGDGLRDHKPAAEK